jgi:hypothetical protein
MSGGWGFKIVKSARNKTRTVNKIFQKVFAICGGEDKQFSQLETGCFDLRPFGHRFLTAQIRKSESE